jgi:dihydroorotate dehydrogenase
MLIPDTLLYRLCFRLLLRRIDPERAHALASRVLRGLTAVPLVRTLVRRTLGARDPHLEVRALGLTVPSPLGAAAGVDKDGSWFESLGAIGFGFVEVGTVTEKAQSGNPKPRVVRLVRERALLNRMGFPNPGARAVARRLRRRTGRSVVGSNVGKSLAAPTEQAGDDYAASVRELAPVSDYLALNVSSPNTPGLREMQAADLLRPLVAQVRRALEVANVRLPLLVKIAPDLRDDELDTIADLAVELQLDGIIAVNTTVERHGLSLERTAGFDGGGVSGAPLKARALEVLERLYARAGDDLVLVSVGGIETAEDAWKRILAGATLVQSYTGFVYGGPAWPRRTNRALARRVRDAGRSSIQDLVGATAASDRADALVD